MSGDWQAGDLALCVRAHDDPGLAVDWWPRPGGVYTVAGLRWGDRIEFVEDPDKFNPVAAWYADHFRKIRPHTPDAEDRRTIELLTGKPAKVEA